MGEKRPTIADNLTNSEFKKLDCDRCPFCFCDGTLELVPEDWETLQEDGPKGHRLLWKCSECKKTISVNYIVSEYFEYD